jgi:hypothetical protein
MSGQGKPIKTGGCDCGAVRYEIDREPIFVNNCYCALCQQRTGGTSAVYAYYEADAVEIVKGGVVQHPAKTGSDLDQIVMHCGHCGTCLFRQPHITGRHGISVMVGTFDDSWDILPDAAIFVSERMPWVPLPEGIPAFDRYYEPAKLLPPERAARLKVVFEKQRADRERAA